MILPLNLPVPDAGMMPAAGAGSPVDSETGFDAALDVALDGRDEDNKSLDADTAAVPEDADAAASEDSYTLVAIELPSACVVTLPSQSSQGTTEGGFDEAVTAVPDAEGEFVDAAIAEAGRIDVAVPANTSETTAVGVSGASSAGDDATESMPAGNVDAKSGVKIADDPAAARLSESTPWESRDKSVAVASRESTDTLADPSIEDEAASEEPIFLRPAPQTGPARRAGQATSEPVSARPQTPNAFAEPQAAGATESAPIAAVATPKPPADAIATANAVPESLRANADSATQATNVPAAVEAEVPEAHAAADAGGGGEFGSSHGKGESFAQSQAGSEPSGGARASGQPFMMLVQSADGTLRLAHAGSVAQAAAPGGPTPEERAENITRLVQTMRVMTKDGISEATIRLRPDHLGEVSIAIRVDGRNVTATVQAESRNVREWLQSQEDSLRSNLSQQGLSLDKLHVQRDPKHDRREQQHEQQRPRYRRPQDVEARFEVSA